ncbi:unnamed protein product [Miscanthus lutarioriparius]|uniref:Uncharacterized protein n=1 Tax=Miscanthus lutarioriparius TaxID=422564 RepID=A0A811Q465_9POAL|nr:unnamed protein product [Miscanthus lutarioriparius]
MSLNVQIEGKISAHDSTSIDASSAFFEEVKDDYSATSIAVPIPLQKTMNDDTYSYDAPQDVEEIVHQNPCENENHIAKLIVFHASYKEMAALNTATQLETFETVAL